jgi:NAD(P)-dependent dehydrogenase (short-subunit alcohol dehydrogenase family)
VAAAAESFGTLTVLVNNAVTSDARDGTITEIERDQWERTLQVNLTAAAWLCRHAIPVMAAAGRGSIVNISSRAAERGTPGHAAYSASKAGLNALTRAISMDHAREGIRANTLSPGYILSEHRDANLDDARRRRLEDMHLTRLGKPSDVAYAALYLASREAEFVTGIDLPVDGGSSTARARTLG